MPPINKLLTLACSFTPQFSNHGSAFIVRNVAFKVSMAYKRSCSISNSPNTLFEFQERGSKNGMYFLASINLDPIIGHT